MMLVLRHAKIYSIWRGRSSRVLCQILFPLQYLFPLPLTCPQNLVVNPNQSSSGTFHLTHVMSATLTTTVPSDS